MLLTIVFHPVLFPRFLDLGEIRNILMENNFDDVICLGDININFDRNTKNVWRFKTFLNETMLKRSWIDFLVDFTLRLLSACITGEGDIFQELTKLNDILGHFANVYEGYIIALMIKKR